MFKKDNFKQDVVYHVNKINSILENVSDKTEYIKILGNLPRMLLKSNNTKVYAGGQRWERELQKRYNDDLFLDGFGYKVYSQNDEDGIIDEIFTRIGVTNKKFIEIGVDDGNECNTHLLLATGWSGYWIEDNSELSTRINNQFKKEIIEKKLFPINSYITRDNVNEVLESHGAIGDIDFFSLDIDGNDWHVMKSVLEKKIINPRVICAEYNALIPPSKNPDDFSTDFIMEYKENWKWPSPGVDIDYQGASLSAFYHLLKDFGYQLVGTCVNGVNAFFVKQELVKDKFPKDDNAAYTYYNPARFLLNKYIEPFHKGNYELNFVSRHL